MDMYSITEDPSAYLFSSICGQLSSISLFELASPKALLSMTASYTLSAHSHSASSCPATSHRAHNISTLASAAPLPLLSCATRSWGSSIVSNFVALTPSSRTRVKSISPIDFTLTSTPLFL